MFSQLMRSRRFAPLFWCQFLSAFNDNFVRQMLAMLILFRFGAEDAGTKVSLAVAIFVLPSIPLSPLGGEIADAHDKAAVARRLKFVEIFVQLVAAAGFYFSSLELLYAALFGLGCIAALFGPIKYGILPDHLKAEELISGNALVEGATFAAIICGLVVGGYAAAQGREPWTVVAQLMVVAAACYGASLFIPPTGIGAPNLKIDFNLWTATRSILRELKADDRQWVGAIAVSWFWAVGAITLSLVPVIVKSRIGGGVEVETAVTLFFAVGIAAGSLLAAVLAHGRIQLAPAPFLLLIMGGIAIAAGLQTSAMPQANAQIGLVDFFSGAVGRRIVIELIAYSCAAGLFVVPVFAAVQTWASEDRRARVIGAVNTLSSVFMVAGSLVTTLLLKLTGLSESMALVLVGLANVAAAIYFFRRLPANFLAFALRILWRLALRLDVVGLDTVAKSGARNIIAVNHVSFLDAPIVLSLLDDAPVIAIDSAMAKNWWVKPFLKLCDARVLDPRRPMAARALVNEVKRGKQLVIFPEGRSAVTGSLIKIFDGAAIIADKGDALVTPVRVDGPDRTPFSRLPTPQVRRRWFPKTTVTFSPPRRIGIDPNLRGRARRRAAGSALYDIMSDLVFATTNYQRTLIEAFEDGARDRESGRVILEDPIAGTLKQRRFRLGVALLARKIVALTTPGETIGLMLPSANAAAVAFMAVQAAGRVAAMLNFTSGAFNVIAACRTASIHLVLSSKGFIEKGKLEDVVRQMGSHVRFVWLEDLRDAASVLDKARAVLDRGREFAPRRPGDPAVVLFTSGSEGLPKGVALSHANILANVAQVTARYDFTSADIVFNPLPIFHAFGLTGGLLLGLITGMKVYLYPTPLHYRQIPELVYQINATALFGTDTFLAGYARFANPYDFHLLRYLVCGAEPVKAETRRIYMEKFGLRILEGYGLTETSPVLAVNTPMFNRNGTVGRLMPAVEHRIEPVPGIDEGGRLYVRGPNIMVGYYRADNPGEIEPPPLGWLDTGDIVAIDRDGFVSIKGRAKRFANIAGEMISLAAVEDFASALWPDSPPAVVAAPDSKKGERIVMATTKPGATRAEVQAWMKIKGASEIMAPAVVLVLEALPLLGSGKIDYVELARIVREKMS
ncbi:MAG: acyl-[ACP]--phospholipid O-acyltransferase [Roseiarcus sp.]|jgi:acyl-[acyl-carrier-protein]-phospholipid O-acyltransferase/long-chain-fatty-acid--[acyl-carrier-protein] ligase